MKTYSISVLARQFGLSRSTLLHYDAIGLLAPSERTDANYRVYTQSDHEKLGRICSLRSTGISLGRVKELMDADSTSVTRTLHKRIDQINTEIQQLRAQQDIIVKLLGDSQIQRSTRRLTKDAWVDLLKSAGLDEQGMHQWHVAFERSMPEAHQDFLESLALSSEEIRAIRKWSKGRFETSPS